MQAAGTMVLLGIGSFFDIKWKKIPTALPAAGAIWGAVCVLVGISQKGVGEVLSEALFSVLPGIALILLSFVTEKKVGAGDGLILVLLGLYEGAGIAVSVFCLGLFLQSLLAVGLLLLKKADRQTCIPFLPFLLAARLIWLAM